MAERSGSQRSYRAPCPGCGAPVEFRSAQSAFAVCPYCQSTVVRQGETLARIGKMAELFDDFSPLQLLASGRLRNEAFTLVGRLQYGYAGGRWTEWFADFGGQRSAILSEDNGAYVFTEPVGLGRNAPPAGELRVGASTAFNGVSYSVSSNEQVAVIAAQGELPRLPPLGQSFAMVELRNESGEVLSLSYDSDPPGAYLGRSVRLEDLQLSGLRGESAREDKARSFNCPNCGAPVTVNLAQSKSITCPSCHSIIDLAAGIGGELRHAAQDEPVRPLIALGSIGRMQCLDWQVVGFQHRMGKAPGEDEQFGWSEYLLYNQKRGFSFLVDAEDGWSMVAPTTGAPRMSQDGSRASYLGQNFALRYAYHAETSYVLGEFYWQVERGQRTFNRDFASGNALLSMEQSANEITWSSGNVLDSATVAQAFKLDPQKEMFKRSDALPLSGARRIGCSSVVLIIVLLVILLIILSTCSNRGGGGGYGGGSRSAGGSFGGYSSGGGHK